MKHIKMPKAIAEAWLKDLRSNPKQGTGSLQDEFGGHCCLGRLQVVVSGDVEKVKNGASFKVPSFKWLEKNKIVFLNKEEESHEAPYCTKKDYNFTAINDDGIPFPLIADLLEEEIEYND